MAGNLLEMFAKKTLLGKKFYGLVEPLSKYNDEELIDVVRAFRGLKQDVMVFLDHLKKAGVSYPYTLNDGNPVSEVKVKFVESKEPEQPHTIYIYRSTFWRSKGTPSFFDGPTSPRIYCGVKLEIQPLLFDGNLKVDFSYRPRFTEGEFDDNDKYEKYGSENALYVREEDFLDILHKGHLARGWLDKTWINKENYILFRDTTDLQIWKNYINDNNQLLPPLEYNNV